MRVVSAGIARPTTRFKQSMDGVMTEADADGGQCMLSKPCLDLHGGVGSVSTWWCVSVGIARDDC